MSYMGDPILSSTNEFDRILRMRQQMWNEGLRRLSMSTVVQQSLAGPYGPPDPLTAYHLAEPALRADPQIQQIRAVEEQSLRQMRSVDDLVGAAKFYGINSPERIPADELEQMVNERRKSVRDWSAGVERDLGDYVYEGLANAIGLIGTSLPKETLRIAGNIMERLPWMGDTLARSQTMREADQWLSMIQEGFTADLPEERANLAKGIGTVIGMVPAAIYAWKLAGAAGSLPGVGTIGARVSPLGRAMIRGAAAETVIQDPTAPLHEQLTNAALGAAFGAGDVVGGVIGRTLTGGGAGAIAGAMADEGDPRSMLLGAALGAAGMNALPMLVRRVQQSWPTQSFGGPADGGTTRSFGGLDRFRGIDTEFVPNSQVDPTFDADFVGENLVGGGFGGGAGAGAPPPQMDPSRLLGPGAPLEGTLDPNPRLGRGIPQIPSESSFLGDAEYEIIESLAGARSLYGSPSPDALPGQPRLGPGQYEMGGAPEAPGGPSIWMQTPPEVRGFIRRVVGERRQARREAEIDPLTGAGNRMAWDRARASAEADPGTAIVALDVNNLKAANDLVGHEFGDQAISRTATVAQQVSQQLGIPNRLFRVGGDEFIAVVPADRAAEFNSAMAEAYGALDAQGFEVSISGGIGQTLDEADHYLRAAKQNREAPAFRRLDVQSASVEAASLTKHTMIVESPAMAQMARQPLMDDADAAFAVVESFPGQVGIVQNISDVGKTLRRILQEQMPNGVGPQDFRIVRRPVQGRATRYTLTRQPDMGAQLSNFDVDPDEVLLHMNPRPGEDPWRLSLMEGGEPVGHHGFPTRLAGELHMRQLDDFVPEYQTDLLVSAGRPITNQMVKDYEQFGMFSGQRATLGTTGQEVEIVSLGGEQSIVRPLYGGVETPVPTSSLLPMKSSAIAEDVPGLYEDFRTFAQVRLDQQAMESGMVPLEFYGTEAATQMPLLIDEFLKTYAVQGDSYYAAALKQIIEREHIKAFRAQAPAEDLALKAAMEADHRALVTQRGTREASLEELAAARGMEWVPGQGASQTLVDAMSQDGMRVPLADEAATREFLTNFQRELVDDAPVSPIPIEVIDTPVGYSETTGRVAGEWVDTRHEVEAMDLMLDHAERFFGDIEGGGGGVLPPGGGPPLGSGQPPERPNLPPGQYEMGGPSAWEIARKDQPTAYNNLQMAAESFVSRVFRGTRQVFMMIDTRAREMGVQTRFYDLMSELENANTRKINRSHAWKERAYQAIRPVRNKYLRNGAFWEAANAQTPAEAAEVFQRYGFNPAERQAVNDWHALMGEFREREALQVFPEMGEVTNYVTWMERFEAAIPGNPRRTPGEASWGSERRRGETPGPELEKDMSKIIPRYFDGLFKYAEMNAPYEAIKRELQVPGIPPTVQRAVGEWAQARMWGLDPSDDLIISGIHQMLDGIGKHLGVRFLIDDVMKMGHLSFSTVYRQALGWDIAALVRDVPQGLIGGMHVGLDKTVPTLKRFIRDDDYRAEVYQRARESGWIQEGHGQAVDADIFGGTTWNTQGMREAFGETAVRRREQLASVADVVQDRIVKPLGMEQGMVGTAVDPLTAYGRMGDATRAWLGETGYQSAMEAMRTYTKAIEGVYDDIARKGLRQQLLDDSRVGRFQGPIQQKFLDMVDAGDYEGAARFFGNEVANTQNRYGMTEHPAAFRRMGPMTGRLAMRFKTFNTQTLANNAQILADPAISARNKAAYAAQVGALQLAFLGAEVYTGWNFTRMALGGLASLPGTSIFGLMNSIQRFEAWMSSETGNPVTPEGKALLGARQAEYGSTWLTADPTRAAWNPWQGGFETVQGLAEASEWGPEGIARFLTTGERRDPAMDRLRQGAAPFHEYNSPFIETAPGQRQGFGQLPQGPPQGGAGAM